MSLYDPTQGVPSTKRLSGISFLPTLSPGCSSFHEISLPHFLCLWEGQSTASLPNTHTPGKEQLRCRGIDRWVGAQDPVSTPARTVEAKSLLLIRRLMAPARPRLEPAAKQQPPSAPSGSGDCPPHPGNSGYPLQPGRWAGHFAAARLL